MEKKNCPKCNADCQRDEVDIGVGTMYGPWGCPECGWSEQSIYDLSEGQGTFTDEGVVDQFGGLTPIGGKQ